MSRLSMKTPDGIKCDQCGMMFSSEVGLTKHKEKFCIGLPDSGNNREDLTLGDTSIELPENILNQTPKNMINSQQATFYIGSPQPKAQSPIPDLQPKPLPRKQSASIKQDQNTNNLINNSTTDIKTITQPLKTPIVTYNKNTKTTPSKVSNYNTYTKNGDDDKQIKAIEKLQNFKAQKSIEQAVKDMEDLTVRDTIRDKRLVNTLHSTSNENSYSNFNNESDTLYSTTLVNQNEPYKSLLKEYSELKNKEKLVLKEVYELNTTENASELLLLNDPPLAVDPRLNEKENIKSPINTQQMIPNLATTNNYFNDQNQRYLKQIEAKTLELERERKEIQQKLENLRTNETVPLPQSSRQSLNRILSELKDQERINETALELLKKRIVRETVIPHSPTRTPYITTQNMYLKRSPLLNNSFTKVQTPQYPLATKTSQFPLTSQPSVSYLNTKSYNMLDDSLSPEEVRHMRMNYLQNGGHDSSVLSRFTEMEYLSRYSNSNIQTYNPQPLQYQIKSDYKESNSRNTKDSINLIEMSKILDEEEKKDRNDPYQYKYVQSQVNMSKLNSEKSLEELNTFLTNSLDNDFGLDVDDKIRKVENDNKRLQLELEVLHDKYRTLNNSTVGDTSLDLIKNKDYDVNLERVKNMLKNYDTSKYDDLTLPPITSNRSRLGYDDVPNLVLEQKNNLSISNPNFSYAPQTTTHRLEQQPLTMIPKITKLPSLNTTQSYDPIGGFVMFIDFITNLDVTIACSRVITCLHHPKTGLGEPSILPLVNCETYMEGGRPSTVALISTKQPVPRCPPQQALTILIELQLASKEVNESKLRSCAWTKIPLFDFKNRLLSGRWRMPLKTLPIKSDANLSNFNSFQSFNKVEFFYRLVNARDADEQTNAPISPAYAEQYQLPPQDESESQYIQYNTTTQSNAQHHNTQHTKNQSTTINQHAPIPSTRQPKNLNNNNNNNNNNNIPQQQQQQQQKILNNHHDDSKITNNTNDKKVINPNKSNFNSHVKHSANSSDNSANLIKSPIKNRNKTVETNNSKTVNSSKKQENIKN